MSVQRPWEQCRSLDRESLPRPLLGGSAQQEAVDCASNIRLLPPTCCAALARCSAASASPAILVRSATDCAQAHHGLSDGTQPDQHDRLLLPAASSLNISQLVTADASASIDLHKHGTKLLHGGFYSVALGAQASRLGSRRRRISVPLLHLCPHDLHRRSDRGSHLSRRWLAWHFADIVVEVIHLSLISTKVLR